MNEGETTIRVICPRCDKVTDQSCELLESENSSVYTCLVCGDVEIVPYPEPMPEWFWEGRLYNPYGG